VSVGATGSAGCFTNTNSPHSHTRCESKTAAASCAQALTHFRRNRARGLDSIASQTKLRPTGVQRPNLDQGEANRVSGTHRGAITGTAAAAAAIGREIYASRVRLAVSHSINLNMSRLEPGEILGAWLLVGLWNRGRRSVTVERAGLEFFYQWQEGTALHMYDRPSHVEFALGGRAIELSPDGPRHRLYTPLGPLLAIGIDPIFEPVWAWAHTTNGRKWTGPSAPILRYMPPRATPEQVEAGLQRLRDASEPPTGSDPPFAYMVEHDPPDFYEA